MARRARKAAQLIAAGLAAVCALWSAVALDRISAESLRSNITWLASDQRAGRLTPSRGLEASADYLADQFRRAGLAPGGTDGSFFQTASFAQVTQRTVDFRMAFTQAGRSRSVNAADVAVLSVSGLDFQNETVVCLNDGPLPEMTGRVVAGGEAWSTDSALYALRARKPSLILLALDGSRPKSESPVLLDADPALPPVIRIYNRGVRRLFAINSRNQVRLNLHVRAPIRSNVSLRNVAGILGGSDPAVRDQFVIVSAHYDHLGERPPGPGDRVYNGANDNASGAASLIEIAKALRTDPHPRRGVLFLAVFGEEEGLLGSAFYVRHPLVPIARTIADINLEQLGRTDSSDGPEIARLALTGPSYSNLAAMMAPAVKLAGATLYKKENGDDYFDRSDNYSFALAGIVAHTAVVAFEFADYHAVSDEASKIDYNNLVKVDKGIAAGVAAVANAASAPQWSGKPPMHAGARR